MIGKSSKSQKIDIRDIMKLNNIYIKWIELGATMLNWVIETCSIEQMHPT